MGDAGWPGGNKDTWPKRVLARDPPPPPPPPPPSTSRERQDPSSKFPRPHRSAQEHLPRWTASPPRAGRACRPLHGEASSMGDRMAPLAGWLAIGGRVGLGVGVDMGQNWNLGSWHSKFQRENQGFSGRRESTRGHRHTVSLTQSQAFQILQEEGVTLGSGGRGPGAGGGGGGGGR